MPIIDPESRRLSENRKPPRLQVVVGILERKNNQYLIQQRPEGKDCAGQWEFPGGKVEPGEGIYDALIRELLEELGVTVVSATLLTRITHNYDHANVLLWVFVVSEFDQIPRGREGQKIAWGGVDEIGDLDVLAAVYPILEKLK